MAENPYSQPESSDQAASQSISIGWTVLKVFGVGLIGLVLLAMLLPTARDVRPATRQTICKNNLKQIGLALHNYHDVYEVFPPAYTVNSDEPASLSMPFVRRPGWPHDVSWCDRPEQRFLFHGSSTASGYHRRHQQHAIGHGSAA